MISIAQAQSERAEGAPRAGTPARGQSIRRKATDFGWWATSLLFFVGLWELAWAIGWAPELTLPPPHIFLNDFLGQAKFFETRGSGGDTTTGMLAVLSAVGATLGRVVAGLAVGFTASLVIGVLVTQFAFARRLLLPMVTLLAPISPIAWLPISIFLFGVGNGPAVFMVFVGVFFMMTLSTIADINGVSATYHNVARTLGATKAQVLFQVTLPAIFPAMLRTLRLNLFAAWMIVLVAEAVGVGQGLGQIVMLARNTFDSSLVFFTMTIIGIAGYLLDILFRSVQRRLLWWDTISDKAATK